LLQQLGHAGRGAEGDSSQQLFETLSHLFTTHLHSRSHLIVLDGVWDYSIVEKLRCSTMSGAVLLTARERIVEATACSPDHILWLQPDATARSAARELMASMLGEPLDRLPADKQVRVQFVQPPALP
jgi:hypothetical protein